MTAKILSIDDSQLDCNYLQLMLKIKKLPATIHFEHNPEEALNYLHGLPHQEWPHVILVDIKMPLMSGFEFVEHYRRKFYDQHPGTLIFITSASIQIADRERAEQHPLIQGFLEKPITRDDFETYILNRLPQ